MERSFAKEVQLLRLGEGDTFHGEGILAVAKALLQSGVSYVGGYQGAPVSHLMDVFADAHDILDDLGVHFQANGSEASAAAMLAASIAYPIRGAVTWKSVVGTNVASDALSNIASTGVTGGALIVIGEDYGEGSSIMQERGYAFAMKSQIWALDPRPNLPTIVHMVEKGFELSEATNTPVFLQLRIRACHVYGSFETKVNQRPKISRNNQLEEPNFDYSNIVLPPSSYLQEQAKVSERWPKAVEFIRKHKLNEVFDGACDDVGIITQGGHFNAVIRALQSLGLADAFGHTEIPIYVLNVTYPLIPEEVVDFCLNKRTVLVVEEGQPNYLEQAIDSLLRKRDVNTRIVGKDVFPMAGEYTGEVVLRSLAAFAEGSVPRGVDLADIAARVERKLGPKQKAAELLGAPTARPPGFCVGCPERPIFGAMKLLQKEIGNTHVASDIGCNLFSSLPPFNIGNTVMGYGLSLASAAAVAPNFKKRVITVMGDGGFWHNGLATGITSSLFNKDDGVLMIVDNGFSAATGGQYIPSSVQNFRGEKIGMSIERTLRGLGVKWLKTVHSYDMARMIRTLRDAMTTKTKGLKVIIARGECQLNRQRRLKREVRKKLAAGKRVVRPRFGVDANLCTGDHSCIRLSGCPSLTIKKNPDPLRIDPVTYVNNDCVGCGVCGEVAHAAVLCPSFYKAEIIQNPNRFDFVLNRARRAVIGFLQGGAAKENAAA